MKLLKVIVLSVSILLCGKSFAQSYLPEKEIESFVVKPAIGIKAYAFNLKDVKLLAGSPFKDAIDIDGAYIFSLNPDKLLSCFNKNTGLPPKDSAYGGWEREGVSGHTLGHYLPACIILFIHYIFFQFNQQVPFIITVLTCSTTGVT